MVPMIKILNFLRIIFKINVKFLKALKIGALEIKNRLSCLVVDLHLRQECQWDYIANLLQLGALNSKI